MAETPRITGIRVFDARKSSEMVAGTELEMDVDDAASNSSSLLKTVCKVAVQIVGVWIVVSVVLIVIGELLGTSVSQLCYPYLAFSNP